MNEVRVALVSAPVTMQERYGKFAGAGSTEPSYALACLGAVARSLGHCVSIVDAAAQGYSVERTLAELNYIRPEVLAISSVTMGVPASAELAARAKNTWPGMITVIGGCHVTAVPELTMQTYDAFDIAVVGEGEDTFQDLLSRISDKREAPVDVLGTAARGEGGVRLNNQRSPIDNLDRLPRPAWDLLPGFPSAFRPSPARIRRFPCASVVFSRGCPYRCLYCDRSVFGSRVRSYSLDYIMEMIRELKDQYWVNELLIEDDTFTISPQKMKAFCERLISEHLNMSWSCLGRADRVTPDMLRLMRLAGCWHISYGIESGDAAILKSVNKREDLQHIQNAVRWSREARLRTTGFFMVGFPGETHESIRLTRQLALSLPLDDITVMHLTPFPGSAIYCSAAKYGTFTEDWRKMNVLNIVFVPYGLSREDLELAKIDMLKSFYLRPVFLLRKLWETLRNPPLYWPMIKGFMAFMRVIANRPVVQANI